MTPTIDLLKEVLTDLTKKKQYHESILTDINEKIQSHENALKIIEDASNDLRRTEPALTETLP